MAGVLKRHGLLIPDASSCRFIRRRSCVPSAAEAPEQPTSDSVGAYSRGPIRSAAFSSQSSKKNCHVANVSPTVAAANVCAAGSGSSNMPLGMTALEIVLFVTPRVFLFVAGPVRIQKIRTKPKVSVRYLKHQHRRVTDAWPGDVDHIPHLCQAEAHRQRASSAVSRHAVGRALHRRCA